jgi:alkyl sulfatase BDS1-like metallo-beta-lactamase superfamily hydrolase
MADEKKKRKKRASPNILGGTEGVKEVVPGVHILPGQGNCLAVDLGHGMLLVDSGPGGPATDAMISSLRELSQKPVEAICYSHGHAGYNAGIPAWLAHNEERGDPKPRLIAHRNVAVRYARYRQTNGLQQKLNQMQFPLFKVKIDPVLVDPSESFSECMAIEGSERRVELIWAPSETDDTLALWVPDAKVLYASAAVPGASIPNIGTPLRTQRLTIRWAETLERLAALGAEAMVQEFGPVVSPADAVRTQLLTMAGALRWLHAEVVLRMNAGMTDTEIVADIEAPNHLFDHPYMRPIYGSVEYIIRDIYREENGWWADRNPTSLHPLLPRDAARSIADAITDKGAVLDRARELMDQGETQAALHVVDLLALAPGEDPFVVEARALKVGLCRARAGEVKPYVSKALFESAARRYEKGKVLLSDLDEAGSDE